jgi:hypothetical protein
MEKGFGLKPLKKDIRDFKYENVFGSVSINEIPDNFVVANPLEIKNQGYSDMCVAYATCAVSEDQENVLLNPKWFFAKMKEAQGNWKRWGADLREGAKVAVNLGFLEDNDTPYNLKYGDRDFIANWENWPKDLDDKAQIHKKQSYFAVGSDFDSIRTILWQNIDEKKSVLTGVLWEAMWNELVDGIIPEKSTGSQETPHAIKIFGQKKIEGKLYLVAQLSNGEAMGGKGLYYFPKEVVDKKFTFGAFIFKDIDPDGVKMNTWNFWQKAYDFIIKTLKI